MAGRKWLLYTYDYSEDGAVIVQPFIIQCSKDVQS